MIFLLCLTPTLNAQSISGTTGLFSIPSARVMPDKTIASGFYFFPGAYSSYSRNGRYDNGNFHVTLTFLPRIELMFRYTRMFGLDAEDRESIFMDRMVTARVQLMKETLMKPSILVGFQDFGGTLGTSSNSYFGTNYLVTSKNLTAFVFETDFTLGYAFDLKKDPSIVMKGFFGGVEITYSKLSAISLLTEFDSSRLNTAVKADFRYVQFIAGWMGMKYFSGGISIKMIL